MRDLRANGQVALVCARPPDERGCQVKGVFIEAREARDDERPMVIDQWERFRDKLAMIGHATRHHRRLGDLALPRHPPAGAGPVRSDAGPRRRREAHVSVTLESLASCWQGLIPATLYTCSLDGVPNAAYLSHVDYVDARHVALSFQFFNKSRRNVAENPQALVRVIDPDTSQCWVLRLRLVRSETSGPVFDRMALRIEAIASYSGLKGIFKLLAADVYEVLSIEKALDELAPEGTAGEGREVAAADPRFTMRALQDLSVRIHQATSLDELLDSILAGIDEAFNFHHSMILVPSEEPNVLVTIASRGYPENGVGAEARIGEGIIGVVAEARQPIRIAGLLRAMLYAHAVAERARQSGLVPARAHSPARPGTAREPARSAAAGSRRAGRRAVHRERGALSLPRGRQDVDRALRQLRRDCDPEHATAGARGEHRGRTGGPGCGGGDGNPGARRAPVPPGHGTRSPTTRATRS